MGARSGVDETLSRADCREHSVGVDRSMTSSHHPRPHSSGFRTFLNWFKRVESSRRPVEPPRVSTPVEDYDSDSNDSETSTATASSFAFLPPAGYRPYGDALAPNKFIASGPYTETYRWRVAERERRKRLESGVTLRKKYKLHGADATLTPLRETNSPGPEAVEYDTFSLPVMRKRPVQASHEHRRATSESKFERPLSYVHVKGKRRAPPPPSADTVRTRPLSATITRRVKRMAPQPPATAPQPKPPVSSVAASENQLRVSELLFDRKKCAPSTGASSIPIEASLKPVTTTITVSCAPLPLLSPTPPTAPIAIETDNQPKITQPIASPSMMKKNILLHSKSEESWKPSTSALSKEDGKHSPRPWYKRQFSENKPKTKVNDEQQKARRPELPEINFFRYSKMFESKKTTSPKSEQKRFSGLHVLPNISELDREAVEILLMHKNSTLEDKTSNGEPQSFVNPRSARLLISKFNEMNNQNGSGDLRSPADAQIKSAVQKSEESNSKNKSEDAKLKSADDTWVCMKCEKRNNCKKIICSSCFSKKPQENDLFSKNIKVDLLQSFESEVLDALKHLGNMSQSNSGNDAKEVPVIDKTTKLTTECTGYKDEEKQQLREILREMKNYSPEEKKAKNIKVSCEKKSESDVESSQTFKDVTKLNKNPSDNVTPKNMRLEKNLNVNQCSNISPGPSKYVGVGSNLSTSMEDKLKSNILSEIKFSNNAKIDAFNNNKVNAVENTNNNLYANLPPPPRSEPKQTSSDIDNAKSLLKELQNAISKGDDKSAAEIAKKLAQMKVNCTVLGSTTTLIPQNTEGDVTVEVYIEDAESAAGPVRLRVRRQVTLPELRLAVQRQLDIPVQLQRWIVGKNLCVDDAPLSNYNNGDFSQPLFLYVVSPAKTEVDLKAETKSVTPSTSTALEQSDKPVQTTNLAKEIQPQNMTKPTPSTSASAISLSEKTDRPIKTTNVVITISKLNTSESKADTAQPEKQKASTSADHYQQLVQLENQDLITNCDLFVCVVCLEDCPKGSGVVLRECLHSFCKVCLGDAVRYCDAAQVVCPYRDAEYSCSNALQEREVRALVSKEDYEKHLAKSVQLAESNMRGTFHCKTADCRGWCVYENTVNIFKCPICKKTNCLTCHVIHEGENCAQYQERIRREAEGPGENQAAAERTKRMLEDMCAKGDALVCPSCQVVLMKKWGCDWVRCSMCKTEICWVTRGARWGPGGKGDTSAGCRCGVNGVKCHPSCNYCH